MTLQHNRKPHSSSNRKQPAARASLLVVDDEQRIADTLALILTSNGYACRPAYDGTSALALCRQSVPDLVISDVVMPGLNGIQLAQAIREEYPACRVLLFSGQAATADLMDQARASGHVFELLAKPVHPEHLLHTVARMLEVPASRVTTIRRTGT